MSDNSAPPRTTHPVDDNDWDRLQRAHDINRPATEESRMADQRATLIATVASLAATLSLTGAELILDDSALDRPSGIRLWFGLTLVVSVGLFMAAAVMSLGVHFRGRLRPDDLKDHDLSHWVIARAGQLEQALPENWATAAAKHRRVTWALGFLVGGLALVFVLTVLACISAAS